MDMDAGLAYQEIEDGHVREIICPVCHAYGKGNAVDTFFYNNKRLKNLRKAIQRHFATKAHAKAFPRKEKERTRSLRRSRVGLTISRTDLQNMREGMNYTLLEDKLHSMHLASLDMRFLNHSRQFIRAFVENMIAVMDRTIERHLHTIDEIISRKRIFASMADKVADLHRIGDAVGMIAMSECGELHALFEDYLLVTRHTGESLMKEIYDKTFMKNYI
jgi:hypothetical protein